MPFDKVREFERRTWPNLSTGTKEQNQHTVIITCESHSCSQRTISRQLLRAHLISEHSDQFHIVM
uniref:Uncharacterized protein n=1 Tax=Arundo donax TaxID=35708 RepID=A0A0A9DUB0_ARUDO